MRAPLPVLGFLLLCHAMAAGPAPTDLSRIPLDRIPPLDALSYLHQQEGFDREAMTYGFDLFTRDWFSTNQAPHLIRLAYLPRLLNLETVVRTGPAPGELLMPARECYRESLASLARVLQGVLTKKTALPSPDLAREWTNARGLIEAHRLFVKQLEGRL